MDIKRAHRFRFTPTPEQREISARTFGCTRFVYNHMLRLRSDAWMNEHKGVGYHATSALLTQLKKEPDRLWLNEVSSVPLQQSLRHLQTAFSHFFAKRSQYPAFKSTWDRQSAEYTTSAFTWDRSALTLAKRADPLAIVWSRTLPQAAKITTVTVSKDVAGRYFISLLCDDSVGPKRKIATKVGIDLGLHHFAILSTGEKVKAPKVFRRYEARLGMLQRRAAKKQKGSANRAKARLKVARIQVRIADTRSNFLHPLASRIVRENQGIAVEGLAVCNMKKNRSLAKSISEAGWGEFLRQLEYKAAWHGATLIGGDRGYPSSKRCHDCGHAVSALPPDVRAWVCPECGATHDCDINAARNILTAGLAGLACGETVSPVSP